MCGIAGIAAAEGAHTAGLEEALRRMVAAMRHRGPDDEGLEALPAGAGRPGAMLGAARLAILDLTPAGHQPMHDPATGNWIVMNGEIYNHPEVREALGRERGPWRSRSDAETVLRAYAVWGPSCLDRLRGMFALAVWDAAAGALWCARDRMGIKPLYCHAAGERFLFASEVRALLASGLVPGRPDPRALAGFVRFGSVPEPLTLVEDVRALPAGHWMRARQGRVEEVRRYWRLDPRSEAASPEEAARALRGHLERAAREHLLSDVPVASFLSGGIDSSVVTALAARASHRPLRTFTVGFREAELDESRHAEALAARYGTDHHRLLLSDEEAAAQVPEAVRSMDLPSADGVNTYVVSRAAAGAGAKVVLSGLGGDELFGGYRSFRLLARAHRLAPILGVVPERLRRLSAPGDSGERAADLTARRATLLERYETLRALWSRRGLRGMGLDPAVGYGAEDPGDGLPLPTRVSALELQGYLRTTLLRDGDAMSMARSLEMRVPFLDHELVEWCLRFAASSRRGRGPKPLLLRAAGELLPPGIGGRPKHGFVLPMARWMRGPLRGFVSEGLARLEGSGALPCVDLPALEARFLAGELPWARLWQMAVLGHWLEAHLR